MVSGNGDAPTPGKIMIVEEMIAGETGVSWSGVRRWMWISRGWSGCRVVHVERRESGWVQLYLSSLDGMAVCYPGGEARSGPLRERVEQRLAHLVIRTMAVVWDKRRLYCDNDACGQRTFAETGPMAVRGARVSVSGRETRGHLVGGLAGPGAPGRRRARLQLAHGPGCAGPVGRAGRDHGHSPYRHRGGINATSAVGGVGVGCAPVAAVGVRAAVQGGCARDRLSPRPAPLSPGPGQWLLGGGRGPVRDRAVRRDRRALPARGRRGPDRCGRRRLAGRPARAVTRRDLGRHDRHVHDLRLCRPRGAAPRPARDRRFPRQPRWDNVSESRMVRCTVLGIIPGQEPHGSPPVWLAWIVHSGDLAGVELLPKGL